MTECLICASKFTQGIRKEIKCQKCDFPICLQCLKTDIKTIREDENRILCFNPECRNEFDLDFLSDILSSDFIKKFVMPKKVQGHKSEQYALMGETQHYMKHLTAEKEWKTGIRAMGYDLIDEYKERISEIKMNIYKSRPIYDKSKFEVNIFKCPTPSCRGHVTISGECSLCNKKFCTECMEPMEEGHICKEETLQSLKLMKENSKPCPHCNMFISKIDGCNQMWCFNCKGFWDWGTGKKINIVARTQIHNPDFLRYERENLGGNIRTDLRPCDDVPDTVWRFNEFFRKSNFICVHFGQAAYINYMYDSIYKSNLWISDYEGKGDRYLKTRIKYLEGKITKEQFEKKIQQLKLVEIKDNKMAELLYQFRVEKKIILRNFLDISSVFVNYETGVHRRENIEVGLFLGFVKLYIAIKENQSLDLYYMRLIKNLHYTYGYKNSFSFQGYAYINRREVQFYDRMRSFSKSGDYLLVVKTLGGMNGVLLQRN